MEFNKVTESEGHQIGLLLNPTHGTRRLTVHVPENADLRNLLLPRIVFGYGL